MNCLPESSLDASTGQSAVLVGESSDQGPLTASVRQEFRKGVECPLGGDLSRSAEPLVSEADWRSLTNRLRMTKNNFKANGAEGGEAKHARSGICRCNTCGGRLTRNSSAGTAWWRCRHRLCNERGGAKEQQLLPLARAECIAAAAHLAKVALSPKDQEDPRRAPLLQQLEQLKQQQLLMPDLEYLKAGVVELEGKLQALETVPVAVDPELLQGMQQLLETPSAWEDATPEELRSVLSHLLLEIRLVAGAIRSRSSAERIEPRSAALQAERMGRW